MDRTESTVRNLLTAIEAPLYDVGVLGDRGMLPGLDGISAGAVLERLSLLKYRNARGSHIYIRPSGEHRFTTLDDLSETSLARLSADGFSPSAVVETSAGNFQAGSNTPECFRSSSEPLPRRHWPSGTTLTPARRTGGGLDGFPASPTANLNTESQTASSLSCACTATADNSTRWRRPSSKR
jgi:RepB DNA-primase from phage plasmid